MRGQFYLVAREFKRAEEDARFLIEKDAASAPAHQLLAGSLAGQQRREEAVESFARVAALSPSDATAFLNLGIAEVSLKRFDEARRHFEQAIELDQKSVPAYLNLAETYRMQGKSPQALDIIRRAVSANPQAAVLPRRRPRPRELLHPARSSR
jgi:tetratricopeptide (TPR) repeat protein